MKLKREQYLKQLIDGKNKRNVHPQICKCLELKKVDTMRDQSKRVNGRKKSKA